MRILFFGSRDWTDPAPIREAMRKLLPGWVIIHGNARGADLLADQAADFLGFIREAYPADWKKHGRAAGPIRNQQMIDEGKPDIAVCFSMYRPLQGGSKDMRDRLEKANIGTHVFFADGSQIGSDGRVYPAKSSQSTSCQTAQSHKT